MRYNTYVIKFYVINILCFEPRAFTVMSSAALGSFYLPEYSFDERNFNYGCKTNLKNNRLYDHE